jgi:branched-chain amino acid transport system substrate-binding protein
MMSKIAVAAAVCVSLVLGYGPKAKAESKDIVVGFAIALTGWLNAFDGEGANMAKLWIDQTNAKGGLLGRKIKWNEADTKTDRTEAAKAGQEMIDQGAELLVVSCDYDFGAPAALKGEAAGIITVFICAADPKAGVVGVGPLSFSAGLSAQGEGATMAEWAAKKRNLKKAYVLLDDSVEYTKSVCAGFEWEYPIAGGAVVARDTFKNDDPTIASQITKMAAAIKNKVADNVVMCSYGPGGVSATRQIRAAGINVPILTDAGLDGLYWINSVPGLKDFYLPVQAVVSGDPSEEINQLTKDYAAKYGKPPTTMLAYPMYAWLQEWAKAVTTAGTTEGKAVVAIMETYVDVPSVLGPRTYTHKWHITTSMPMTIVEIANGKQNVVDRVRIPNEIPDNVLLRVKK